MGKFAEALNRGLDAQRCYQELEQSIKNTLAEASVEISEALGYKCDFRIEPCQSPYRFGVFIVNEVVSLSPPRIWLCDIELSASGDWFAECGFENKMPAFPDAVSMWLESKLENPVTALALIELGKKNS